MQNPELGRKVLDYIDEHPEQFNINYWGVPDTGCGTVACFAGHALLQAGYEMTGYDRFRAPDGTVVSMYGADGVPEWTAKKLLGLSDDEYYEEGWKNPLFCEEDGDRAVIRFTAIVEASEAEARRAAS